MFIHILTLTPLFMVISNKQINNQYNANLREVDTFESSRYTLTKNGSTQMIVMTRLNLRYHDEAEQHIEKQYH